MPALFISALLGALATCLGSLVGRAFLALGLGFVSYKGIDVGIGVLKNTAIAGLQGIPADALSFIGYLWLDKALSVVFSAVAVALSMRALGGTVKRLVAK